VSGRGWCASAGCESAAAIGKKRCERCEERHRRVAAEQARATDFRAPARQADLFAAPAVAPALAMPRAGSVGIDTSEGAADRQDGPATATKINARALALLCRLARPERIGSSITAGETCDDLEVALGLPHQTCSGLLWRLEGGGYVTKTALTRPTRSGSPARIYQPTQRALDFVRAHAGSPAGKGPNA
jgi:hypothetical protein